jgi:hypothetical protein
MTLEHLISRDGEVCVWCGRELWRRDLTAEHLLPRARSGRGYAQRQLALLRRI